jgi:hypothetical protein
MSEASGKIFTGHYEVLSPVGEADPVPLKGISPRTAELSDKMIGLYANPKRAARPVLASIEKTLQERYPTARFSWYHSESSSAPQLDTEHKARFEEWLAGVDVVMAAVGD